MEGVNQETVNATDSTGCSLPVDVRKTLLIMIERLLQDMRNAADCIITSPAEAHTALMKAAFVDDSAIRPSFIKISKTQKPYGGSGKRSKTTGIDSSAHHERAGREVSSAEQVSHHYWNLSPLLQADFAEHNPRSMFSEQSSTAPFNTRTQETMIQEALREGVADVARAMTNDETQGTDSSIPWSASLNTQPWATAAGTSSVAEPEDFDHHPPTQEKVNQGSKMVATPISSRQSPHEPTGGLSPSRRSPHNPVSVATQKSPHHLPPSARMLSEIEIPVERQVRVQKSIDQARSADAPVHSWRSISTTQKAPRPSEDEIWAGLPGEQYVPRLSRRRAKQVSEAEYTKNVQQVLQPRPRRRKTGQGAPENHGERLRSVVDIGLSRNSPRQPVAATAGIASEAGDVSMIDTNSGKRDVVNSGVGFRAEAVSPGLDGRQSASTRKTAVEVAIPSPQIPSGMQRQIGYRVDGRTSKLDDISIEQAQVPKHSSSQIETKSRRRHTTMGHTFGAKTTKHILDSDDSSSEVSPLKEAPKFAGIASHESTPPDNVASLIDGSSLATEKKRGRGRPRRSGAADIHTHSTGEPSPPPEQDLETQAKRDAADDRPAEHPTLGCKDRSKTSTVETVRSYLSPGNSILLSTPDELSATRLRTSSQDSLQGSPLRHSPISQGKVPYRVGLSKRARIAPLLRVRRK